MKLLEKVCQELGVEINEEWEDKCGNRFKMDPEDGIMIWAKDSESWAKPLYASVYVDLLKGKHNPVWKPKKGNEYYVPDIRAIKDMRFYNYTWFDDETDEFFFSNNIVFRTKEEAIECANKMLEAVKEG